MTSRLATLEIDAENVGEYLTRRGVVPAHDCSVSELSGGVSGATYLVSGSAGSWVVKQALPRLRVAAKWLASPDRARTEGAAMRICHALTPERTPAVVDVDDARHVVTMTAAPASWSDWKTLLLAGRQTPVDTVQAAGTLGEVLRVWHRQTWHDTELATRFNDYEAFEQLRVAPFHRAVLRRHPDLADPIECCVTELLSERQCLVHGDFSPKNVLLGHGALWVIDFEVGHFGAAVFDVAFLESHLLLKAMHIAPSASVLRRSAEEFVGRYTDGTSGSIAQRLAWHTACLVLARVDGKSPATYLDAVSSERARQLARQVLQARDVTIDEMWDAVVRSGA